MLKLGNRLFKHPLLLKSKTKAVVRRVVDGSVVSQAITLVAEPCQIFQIEDFFARMIVRLMKTRHVSVGAENGSR